MQRVKERFHDEAEQFVKQLFEEQNWENECFEKESLKTVKGLAYWLEYFFDIYESVLDEPEEKVKYSKGIRLIIRELENIEEV